MVKRDKLGRVKKRVPGQYSSKVFAFRVTDPEFDLIQMARKKGHDPREVLLSELRKRVTDEKTG